MVFLKTARFQHLCGLGGNEIVDTVDGTDVYDSLFTEEVITAKIYVQLLSIFVRNLVTFLTLKNRNVIMLM